MGIKPEEDKSSACYTIDENYNIVTYNQTAHDTFPQLKIGKKCHQCLMNIEEPCQGCPVVNNIKGPQTYFDPIRKIYETVDAVEIYLDAKKKKIGHALVLSTTGSREKVSQQLPTTEKELRALLNQDYYDKMTAGYNRNGFVREVERILHAEKTGTKQYCVVVLDIEKFKSINDIFGITGGDKLIEDTYAWLEQNSPGLLVLARLESDRFACLIDIGKAALHQMERSSSFDWEYEGRHVQIHLYIGVYIISDSDMSVSRMLERATLAKQYAKNMETKGRVQFAVYDEVMRKDYVSTAEIIASFQQGLQQHEFEVYYQPVIKLDTQEVFGAEALVRWNHSLLGFLAPDKFIPALEKNGMITKLDQYVLDEVHTFVQELRQQNLAQYPVAINLSWQDFYDNKMMDEIINFIKSTDSEKSPINIEVTETSMAALEQNCAYMLEQFQTCGAMVLLDDFGTGVSSLGMLSHYAFNVVKIDRSFIRQIETNTKIATIIRAVIKMSHRLGMQVVAEGVETKSQCDFLQKLNCDYVQGYYFGKPMPKEQYLTFLRDFPAGVMEAGIESAARKYFQHIDEDFYLELMDKSGYCLSAISPEDYSIIYLNKNSLAFARDPQKPYQGEICYKYLLGLDAPCGHCQMKEIEGYGEKYVEVDDGKNVFAVNMAMSKINGRKVFLEFGRNITDIKAADARYTDQVKAILEALPDGQGVFHVDVTADTWISSGGHAQNARDMQNVENVDTLVHMIASFVPDEKGQQEFFATFCRDAILAAYERGEFQIVKETLSYYDDKTIRWSRIFAHLLVNPQNKHLECLIYGIDISKEREYQEQELLQQARESFAQADHDRRTDFLTGLRNRLDLYDYIKASTLPDTQPLEAMLMLDIDDFKQINDQHGHMVGDACLKQVGEVLNSYGDEHGVVFFRYGGEEFLGLVFSPEVNMHQVAEDILQLLREVKVALADGTQLSFTASLGYTERKQHFEKMVELADRAMYIAKRNGKNRYYCLEEVQG